MNEIIIPENCESIASYAFEYCSDLSNVIFSNSLNRIGENAFLGTALYDKQPNGLIYLNNWLIAHKGEIQESYSLKIKDGTVGITDGIFADCKEITSIDMPNSLKYIGYCSFWGCSNLSSIIIPSSVINIQDYAFYACNNLKLVINYSDLEISKSSHTNGNIAEYANIAINADEQIDNFFFKEREGFYYLSGYIGKEGRLELPINYKGTNYSISDYVFSDCLTLTDIIIPNSVTSIGDSAFEGCTGLTNITIPESVTSIGDFAFEGCTGLTNITISESVTSVGGNAFENTPWYKNQTDGVIYIGLVCYRYKGEIPENTSIILKEGTTSIGSSAFRGCTGLTNITIPNSVTSIGNNAFEDCTQINTIINFSDLNITKGSSSNGYLGYYADIIINADKQIGDFFFKESLDQNTLVAYIGNDSELKLPETYFGKSYNIDNSLFYKNDKLKTINIPNSVINIGTSAFYGCTNLISITFLESIVSLESLAFCNCSSLTNVICYSIIAPKISNSTFRRISKEAILYYPKGSDYSAWSPYFAQMIEMDETDINTPKINHSRISTYNIYDISGRMVRKKATTINGLKAGLYIINGKKVLVK